MIRAPSTVLSAIVLLVVAGVTVTTHAATGQNSEWQRAMTLLAEGDARAIGMMKRAFDDEQDQRARQQIASTLLTLQLGDDRHYDYLAGFVRAAIDRDAPAPLASSAADTPTPQSLSEAFVEWCRERGEDPQQSAYRAIYEDPGHLIYLGQAGDARSFELMLEALEARNPFVAVQAASALAAIGDRRAIAPILALSGRTPDGMRLFLAEALLRFDDPRATAEAARLVPDEVLASLHQVVALDKRRQLEGQALRERLVRPATP